MGSHMDQRRAHPFCMKKDRRCWEFNDLAYGTWEIDYKHEAKMGELKFKWFVDGKDDESHECKFEFKWS